MNYIVIHGSWNSTPKSFQQLYGISLDTVDLKQEHLLTELELFPL